MASTSAIRAAVFVFMSAACGSRTDLTGATDAGTDSSACEQGYAACATGCCLTPELALGEHESCLRKSDETVWCWGQLWWGLDGDVQTYWTPIQPTLLGFPVTLIAIQDRNGCVLDGAGVVRCWGAGLATSGVLVEVPGVGSVEQLSAGGGFICALVGGGAVQCWGENYYGMLGDGTRTNRSSAADVLGFSSGARQVAAGATYACALRADGTVACWGNVDRDGGSPGPTNELSPVDVAGVEAAVSIGAGAAFGCALTSAGVVQCWGTIPAMGSASAAIPIDVGAKVTQIAVGWFDVCLLTDTGGVKCWGENGAGETGTGTHDGFPVSTPTDVVGLSSGVKSIVMGYEHGCATMNDGRMMCWGTVTGDGTGQPSNVPVQVVGL